jgi:ribosomal protein S18 acetylase RimI-like enzyme
VAEALVNECIAWAQAQGLVMVKLAVITTNTSAIRCYARCGFTIYGIDPKVIYYNDVFYRVAYGKANLTRYSHRASRFSLSVSQA